MLKSIYLSAGILAGAATMVIAGTAEEIEQNDLAWEAAFNSGDAAAMAALYTEDAVLLPPDGAMVKGRDAVQVFWQGFIDAGLSNGDLVNVAIEEDGDTATQIGTFTIDVPDGNGGTVVFAGKYIIVWKTGDDGVKRIHWDIWNAGQ